EPKIFPLIAYPKAWSPGTKGIIEGEVIYLDAKTDSALETFRGKLKKKFVLFGDMREMKPHFEPDASRNEDSTLLKFANATPPVPRGPSTPETAEQKARNLLNYKKWQMCLDEGAYAVLEGSRSDFGTVFVQGANVPMHPDTSWEKRIRAYDPKAETITQIVVSGEHFNRMLRLIKKGKKVMLEMNLEVEFSKADSIPNIIAEIPGTDLKDEIVMVGGHFDSWHAGTGTTDNGTGSSVAIEAMRILKTLNVQPRRTIRIALWGGEEQGLLGSNAYVKAHFGEKQKGSQREFGEGEIVYKPEAEKFSVYFNDDNGTGKFRGIYLQGNEETRGIFREWFKPFKELGASTITISNTGGTDHQSFDAIGLPGFQFIQDGIEYFTRTWHSNMDVYERAQEDDLKQSSVIMATFLYNAAMRDAKFPRKPLPKSVEQPATH
ncbi:MAG: M20/M25/M40 family metallo-hydrolase, partial [Bacteroidota bacterium]